MRRSSRSSSRARAAGFAPGWQLGQRRADDVVGLEVVIAANRFDDSVEANPNFGGLELGALRALAGFVEAALGVGAFAP